MAKHNSLLGTSEQYSEALANNLAIIRLIGQGIKPTYVCLCLIWDCLLVNMQGLSLLGQAYFFPDCTPEGVIRGLRVCIWNAGILVNLFTTQGGCIASIWPCSLDYMHAQGDNIFKMFTLLF